MTDFSVLTIPVHEAEFNVITYQGQVDGSV